jgi:hypothetical protein
MKMTLSLSDLANVHGGSPNCFSKKHGGEGVEKDKSSGIDLKARCVFPDGHKTKRRSVGLG